MKVEVILDDNEIRNALCAYVRGKFPGYAVEHGEMTQRANNEPNSPLEKNMSMRFHLTPRPDTGRGFADPK